MNKNQFINYLSKRLNTTIKNTQKYLNETKLLIIDILQKGEKLCLRDFGNFALVEKNERIYFNPQTHGKILVPAKKMIVFRQSKRLINL